MRFIDEAYMDDYTERAEAISCLSPENFQVTQQNATNRPFENAYWDHDEPGIYVDIVSDELLSSSLDKFDSNCGWPSFPKPVEADNVDDGSHGMGRTEVRSSHAVTVILAMSLTRAQRRWWTALLHKLRIIALHSSRSGKSQVMHVPKAFNPSSEIAGKIKRSSTHCLWGSKRTSRSQSLARFGQRLRNFRLTSTHEQRQIRIRQGSLLPEFSTTQRAACLIYGTLMV